MFKKGEVMQNGQTWEAVKYKIYADIYRNLGYWKKRVLIKQLFSRDSTVSLLIYFRLCSYFAAKKKNPVEYIIHGFLRFVFKRKQVRLGIELNQNTQIGYGLRLPHRGAIVIHHAAKIGNNCEIMQGVTIGNNLMKSRSEVAVIGNNVILSAGAKIIGPVTIGDNVIVGANAVVAKNIESNTTVGGVPARVLSEIKCVPLVNSDY